MKRLFKTFVVSILLVTVSCMPVFAQEVTDPTKVYTEDKFNIDEGKLVEDFHRGQITRCDNYVKYLDGVIFNLNETARIKKEVVTNYRYLAQFNSYYATFIPQAQKEYEVAVAWVDAYKQYRNAVASDLRVCYNY